MYRYSCNDAWFNRVLRLPGACLISFPCDGAVRNRRTSIYQHRLRNYEKAG